MTRLQGAGSGRGEAHLLLAERGSSFGNGNLVVGMRSLLIMCEAGSPVVFDAAHSMQLSARTVRAWCQREFVPVLARAAVGVAGPFLETQPDPADALYAMPLDKVEGLMKELIAIRGAVANPS